MSVQPRFTFTENFSSIATWSFASGSTGQMTTTGAEWWKGVAAGGSGSIPNGTRITTSTTNFSTSENSGGLHKGNESLVLLSTGTTDNTTSAAVDLYLNFSTLNAGLLNFDWKSINNSSGNRNGSLRIYASVDNVSFTEITGAQVLNFTNNNPTAGSVRNVQLPAAFNNAQTAILRFYYHNGTGGTTGARPKISIDNLQITAVPPATCVAPQQQPTALVFNYVTPTSIQGSVTASNPGADSYLVLATTNGTPDFPENGSTYHPGDNIDDAVVVSTSGTSFNFSDLNPGTQYYFHVFAYNALCSGGPAYNTVNSLTGDVVTPSGNQPCVAPQAQPTDLILSNISSTSVSGSFSPASYTDEYLVIRSSDPSLSVLPVAGNTYAAGDTIGNGIVVSSSAATNFTANGLASSTTWYFYVFGYNNQMCNNGPAYLQAAPLTANATTQALQPCNTPSSQPTNLQLSPGNDFINGLFDPVFDADRYLVIVSTSSTLSAAPVDGASYTAGSAFGNGTVVSSSFATGFRISNLQPGTSYYVFVFAVNQGCVGGPKYFSPQPLTATTTTTTAPVFNHYFGNLHAHSRYSDGNKDNSTFTPADNYAYAKNSLCMDFLGISEHNHAGAGMKKQNWLPGYTQAMNATSSNFLALYGMEWGVTSSGGHVLVYGVDKLVGWETNNYDLYVAKSDYTGTPATTGTTGLFRFLNNWGNNAFAILAHPGSSDFNALLQQPYNATADSAVIGTTVENGPAFSTVTNYSNPASPMGFLSYYRNMLAKGYKIGPSLDHDNHNTTFGRTAYSRLAVIAPDISKASFMQAMRNRNFYATHDCDTRVSFTLNHHIMGSEASGNNAPAITIHVSDPTNISAVATIRLMKGEPGSGVLASEVYAHTGNTLNFTDFDLQPNTTGYYYADITMDGARTITAPIWYTRLHGSVLSAEVISFTAVKTTTPSVNLTWNVAKEETLETYVVERSLNGSQFETIYTTRTSTAANGQYSALDLTPANGLNYYRLKMISKDGKVSYSKVVAVNFKDANVTSLDVYPNPVSSVLQMNINSTTAETATVFIQDVFGRSILARSIGLRKGVQVIPLSLDNIPGGTYFISLQLKDQKLSKKIVKQ